MSFFSQLDLALRGQPESIDFDVMVGSRPAISVHELARELDKEAVVTKTGDILFHYNGNFRARLIFDPKSTNGFRVYDHYVDDRSARRALFAHVCKQTGLQSGEKLVVFGDEALRWSKSQAEGRRRAIAEDLWKTAHPTIGTIAESYLRSRGIVLPLPEALRFSPAALHPDENCRYPAMLGMVSDPLSGAFKGLHVTALRPDGRGKANTNGPTKWLIGPTGGGAVLLSPVNGTNVAIAEGIETALSFAQLYGWPTIAALNAGNLGKLLLPPSVSEVVVAADHDVVGMKYATAARERFLSEGRIAKIVCPRVHGEDWNVVLTRLGHVKKR